jgi:hypothetical protein
VDIVIIIIIIIIIITITIITTIITTTTTTTTTSCLHTIKRYALIYIWSILKLLSMQLFCTSAVI